MTRKANPAVWHKTAQASFTDHSWVNCEAGDTAPSWWQPSAKKHLDFSYLSLETSGKAICCKHGLPCCTFCPLSCKKDFSDSSSTNFLKRIPTGKLLDCITRHSRWQAENCNWELYQEELNVTVWHCFKSRAQVSLKLNVLSFHCQGRINQIFN